MFYLNKKHPMLSRVLQKLDEEGRTDLKAYLALIEGYAPSVQSGMMSYLSEQTKTAIDDNDPAKLTDIREAKNYIKKFLESGFTKEEVENIILGMPNYKYIETDLIKIFEGENYD